jgi:hypothetical protein
VADITNYVPVQLTKAFRDAQTDETFRGWLKMQEAAMDIEFPYHDLPELRGRMFTMESLDVVEVKLLELFANHREAFSDSNIHVTNRYAYYVGETLRRAFEGTWVVLPPNDERDRLKPAVDYPFREAFTTPTDDVKVAVNRRSGTEFAQNYRIAALDYTDWVNAGRPERTFLGRLRED